MTAAYGVLFLNFGHTKICTCHCCFHLKDSGLKPPLKAPLSTIRDPRQRYRAFKYLQNCRLLTYLIRHTQNREKGWRPEPESNRRGRFCKPLRDHSAIGPNQWKIVWRAANWSELPVKSIVILIALVPYPQICALYCRAKDAVTINSPESGLAERRSLSRSMYIWSMLYCVNNTGVAVGFGIFEG